MDDHVITEDMVTRAYEILSREAVLPHGPRIGGVSAEDILDGKLRFATEEADRKNRTLIRLALEAAYLTERNTVYNTDRIQNGIGDKPTPTAVDRLKDAWNDNPLVVIGVATGACMAVAKLIDAVSSAQGRRAYSKQVNMKAKRPRSLCNS